MQITVFYTLENYMGRYSNWLDAYMDGKKMEADLDVWGPFFEIPTGEFYESQEAAQKEIQYIKEMSMGG